MIRFSCPTCKSLLQAPPVKAGEKVACPKCGQRLLIPNPVKPAARNKTVLGVPLPSPRSSSSNLKPDSLDVAPPQGRDPRPPLELGIEADDLNPRQMVLRCPRCGSEAKPTKWKAMPAVGWLIFVVLLLFFFPLFWLPFCLYELWYMCPDCRYSYQAGPVSFNKRTLGLILAIILAIIGGIIGLIILCNIIGSLLFNQRFDIITLGILLALIGCIIGLLILFKRVIPVLD